MAEDDSSVKVAVRIRPQIAREVIDMCRVCTTVMPGEPQVLLGSDKAFTYDYVFDTGTPQSQVYDTCVECLVDGSLEGYNATVLAYGQTGSGKTYTMGTGFDVELDPDQTGIIPRSIHHMFDGITRRIETARQTGEPSPEFKVTAQFMELYNEEVIDLFEPNCNARRGAAKIHEDPTGSIYVVGVTSRSVVSADDALQCLRLGALSRTTASTDMNSQSSRSHAIFTLLVKQRRLVKIKDPDSDDDVPSEAVNEFETLTAKFHFVDLAGSERLKRTGATGERAREGISINCGLLALGNVISALGDKSKKALHIPYRDSKLTRLLQDSLGGNSQTVMIACVSPSDRDFMETLNTLKYANRARNIKNRVTINQDKSSRTITLLRQEIQQLQLELQEYKQGKRVVGEDGVESVNDMFHENMMLQTEINKMRTRVKAMQETIDALSSKNSQLLAEKATVGWITSGSDNDVTELIQGYLKEIEELRAKLLESESTCQQLRKVASRPTNRSSNTGQFELSLSSSAVSVIEEAKKELNRDREALSRILAQEREKRDGAEEGDSDGEDRDGDLEDSESDTDTEDKEDSEPQEEYGLELAELNSEIDIKQKLIDELEQSQRRLHVMKQQYEDKLQQLMARIKNTQEERDKVLASYSGQNNQPSEKVRKVKDEYERKLTDMQKELKRLQSAQREHVKLLRNQSQHESQLRSLKSDLNEMKKSKVKLMNRMKEEAQRHKEADLVKKREIAQLRKASRRQEHQIRSLESDTKIKEALLRRKNEEVSALRRATRTNMSNKAAGRVGPRHTTTRSKTINFSPKVAKQKWQAMEKNISKMALNKQAVAAIEREMERQITERERLSHELEKLTRQRDLMCRSGTEEVLLQDLDEQIENIRANIEYVQENIAEAQQNVVQVEEIKGGLDGLELGQGLIDVNEARYFIEKLYNMAVSQTYIAAQKELGIKEMEIKLNGITQRNQVQDELFQHVVRTQGLDLATLSRPVSSNSSNSSSRSTSPTDTWNGNIRPFRFTTQKARRRTALPSELLYAGSAANDSTLQQEKMTDSLLMGPPRPVTRVPSVPDSLRTAVKPSPVAARKLYDRQESTSPRLNRRAYVMGPGSLMSKLTGSM